MVDAKTHSASLQIFDPELLKAIEAGWNDDVAYVLQRDIHTIGGHLGKLLHYAVFHSNPVIVEHLLKEYDGCNVDELNEQNKTPLLVAVERVELEIIDMLLDAKADIFFINQYGETIAQMVFETDVLERETHNHFLERIRTDFEDDDLFVEVLVKSKCSMFLAAAYFDDIQLMEALLKRGVHIDSPGLGDARRTALHEAATFGEIDMMRWLIANGANINVLDTSGSTPLLVAASHGQVESVEFLLQNGANPNIADKDFDYTPLFAAASDPCEDGDYTRYDRCIELLLEYNADPHNSSVDQSSLFDYAIAYNRVDRLKRLIGHLAMVDARDGPENSVTEFVMIFNLEKNLRLQSELQDNYNLCKRVLASTVYRELSLFDLLTMSVDRMKFYARDSNFISTVRGVNKIMCEKFSFYFEPLMKIIDKAVDAVKLEDEAIVTLCDLFGSNYNEGYIFARKVVDYLDTNDLTQLNLV